jgi:hypothetical protein
LAFLRVEMPEMGLVDAMRTLCCMNIHPPGAGIKQSKLMICSPSVLVALVSIILRIDGLLGNVTDTV